MKKILLTWIMIMGLLRCSSALDSEAAYPDNEVAGSDFLSIGEESIQNVFFKTSGKGSLAAPGHEQIVKNLSFQFQVCAPTQITLLAKARLYNVNQSIVNYQDEVIGRYIVKEKDSYLTTATLTNFEKVEQGNVVAAPLSLATGKYFWLSYGYDLLGNLICSSPQQVFYYRN